MRIVRHNVLIVELTINIVNFVFFIGIIKKQSNKKYSTLRG